MYPVGPVKGKALHVRGRPKGGFTQHRRLDALQGLLLRRPRGVTLREIADVLRVTTRSARRYLAEVQHEFDLERDLHGRGPAHWRVRTSDRPRRLELRRMQAYALLAPRRLFKLMHGSTLYEEIDLALNDLLAIAARTGRGPNAGLVDAKLEDRFVFFPCAPANYTTKADELDVLFHAVADLRPITCRYSDDHREPRSMRLHPYAMILHQDAIYAVGLHVERNEVQTFALEALSDAELSTTDRFELPPDFCVDDYFQGQFGVCRNKAKIRVVIDFAPAVADHIRTRCFHPSQRLSALRGGGVRVTMTVGDSAEVARWVLGFGQSARVVEPDELRSRLMQELRNTLALYRDRTLA